MLHEFDEVRSTNDEALELALGGAPEGTAVLARRQTAGRGRAGRAFLSPVGGLYLSVVLRPRAPPHRWGVLPVAVGAVVAEDLRARGVEAQVKWPNDVLVEGRKVGGVLVESRMGAPPFAVVGVGLNLADAPDVAGVAGLRGRAGEARAVAARLVPALVGVSEELARAGGAALLARARALCATLGREVEWDKKVGVARDLDEDGSLVVETASGLERVVAGDVRMR